MKSGEITMLALALDWYRVMQFREIEKLMAENEELRKRLATYRLSENVCTDFVQNKT